MHGAGVPRNWWVLVTAPPRKDQKLSRRTTNEQSATNNSSPRAKTTGSPSKQNKKLPKLAEMKYN
jgi:hypothetical protein